MILAPLRGVTICCFREVFADVLVEAGFTEAITPFITAIKGYDPLKDRELTGNAQNRIAVTPQFIGKDPVALRVCLERVKAAGYETADLNCGCPYPMVRNKGRGSGILRTPEVLKAMVETGCEVMGPGKFSVKARLGVEKKDELLSLMPMLNEYPLRFLTVHTRTARQMYSGECDAEAFDKIAAVARMPLVKNGDIEFPPKEQGEVMIGRSFIVALGEREDVSELVHRYIDASVKELSGEKPVLGRMKELVSYWRFLPDWHRRWAVMKLARTLAEFTSCLP